MDERSWLPVIRSGVGGRLVDQPRGAGERQDLGREVRRLGRRARAVQKQATQRPRQPRRPQERRGVPTCVSVIGLTDKLLILQRLKPHLRVLEVLAAVELRQQPLEVRDGLSRLIGSGQRLRQIEVHGVPAGEGRVVAQDFAEAVDGARDTSACGSSAGPTRYDASLRRSRAIRQFCFTSGVRALFGYFWKKTSNSAKAALVSVWSRSGARICLKWLIASLYCA